MTTEPRARSLVCLIGFMGSGKSTVARLLGRQIGWQHVDLDKRIVEVAEQTIPEIFSRLGEAEFRKIELAQLQRIVGEAAEQQRPRVVSLCGGTTAQPQNLPRLRLAGAVLVWLQCPMEELLKRIALIQERAHFRDETRFRTLYQRLLPYYVV